MIMVIRMRLRYCRLRGLELSGFGIFLFLLIYIYTPHPKPPLPTSSLPAFVLRWSRSLAATAMCCTSCIIFLSAEYSLHPDHDSGRPREAAKARFSLSQHDLLNSRLETPASFASPEAHKFAVLACPVADVVYQCLCHSLVLDFAVRMAAAVSQAGRGMFPSRVLRPHAGENIISGAQTDKQSKRD